MGWWPVGLYCQPQSHSFSSGLWILDLDFGTGLGLDNIEMVMIDTYKYNYSLTFSGMDGG